MAENLLIYQSSYGGTKVIVEEIAERLPADVPVLTLDEAGAEEITRADRVAVGGGIHAGSLQRGLRQFLEDYEEQLRQKSLTLFLCCMQREYAEEYFLREFPHELTGRAEHLLCLGGDVDPAQLNPFARLLLKRSTGSGRPRQWRNREAMERMISFLSGG